MTSAPLPGKTEWETRQYLADHGHRSAAAMAYHYIARRIETDPDYALPPGHEAIIAAAAAAMQRLAEIREGLAGDRAARAELLKADAA